MDSGDRRADVGENVSLSQVLERGTELAISADWRAAVLRNEPWRLQWGIHGDAFGWMVLDQMSLKHQIMQENSKAVI